MHKITSHHIHHVRNSLWWRKFEEVLLKCVDQEKSKEILKEMHDGVYGGHYMAKTSAHKLTRARFLWHSLFKDALVLVRNSDACKRFVGKLGNTPSKSIEVQAPIQ